jgi:hypothetical protein
MLMLDRVRDAAEEFDILHFHIDPVCFLCSNRWPAEPVTTLYGRGPPPPDLKPLYLGFPEMPLISISDAQREPVPKANFVATVHYGVPAICAPNFDPRGDYWPPWRISPEKRPTAPSGSPPDPGHSSDSAAKIDRADEAYFREQIEPMLQGPSVEFIGKSTSALKRVFSSSARALLFPVDWPEPFGIVMIEAMACGTPVLALSLRRYRRSSTTE